MNSNIFDLLKLRNLQEQVRKAFCYQKLFWPFTVWINCSSDLKNFANSRPSASNLKSFSLSLDQFFLTVGQNNFGNKIPFLLKFSDLYQRKLCYHNLLLLFCPIPLYHENFFFVPDDRKSCCTQNLTLFQLHAFELSEILNVDHHY